ncbi:DNA repair protein RecO [Gottschalkia acidurici 9a]|uniref:DNA repair protein RecO n=1 Tax=Gottschalkia acidurici (strain ATCC 7906 / DSM 604 / BCRC 14475 / CIP 104303 / KCTC 5404 / NCIMB 10678 / 9a) TaxID=1128398 RepID=K0B2H2_GOTA9|nr:DNA repair protein RecO [Gottschalkia acidurici]AFS78816.1 DNA repair protein RecO [Gottschalkia acidurici 9a]
MFIESKGVVIRQTKYSESDRILTIFTKDKGKIQAIAKGARKPKSKLISSTETFCYSEFILYKGKSLYNINQGDVIDSFYSLREDIYKLSYATYILELVDSSLLDEEPNDILFELLVKTLKILSEAKGNYKKLLLAFQIKYISFIGYKPQLNQCVNCGNDLTNNIRFNIIQGGTVCENCFSNSTYEKDVKHTTVNNMRKLMYSKLDELKDIDIDKNEEQKIEEVIMMYITSHIEKKRFKSLEFIKTLEC